MTVLYEVGDGIKGEKLVCEFRVLRGPYLIAGTSAHRAQRAVMLGLPAHAWIEKPMRLAGRRSGKQADSTDSTANRS